MVNKLLALALFLGAAMAMPSPRQLYEPGQASCGGGLSPCPSGEKCVPTSDRCTDMSVCSGVCEAVVGAKEYPACKVNTADNQGCPATTVCITDPRVKDDASGICISEEPQMCGGIGGIQCREEGTKCYEDPRDGCDPLTGGRDCSGICV